MDELAFPLWLLATPIIAVMTWSFAAGVSVAVQAHSISDGKPYCIATTDAVKAGSGGTGDRDYGAIRSLEALRGVRLYTDRTGYKDTSRWYFHGLLVVGQNEKLEYWNWSPRRLSFERVTSPRVFVSEVTNACAPVEAFLSRLPWF